ncbi:MAG: oligosaccharide flippase family protein [Clostridia bacterium]|nr:oligosaccharide flippase family protein [Clostridia bacterium]
MSKQNVLRSAAFLTLSGIIAKTVDFLFRAYYSKQLGSEGMGILSLVFSFHGLILTFATGGFGVAVSKTLSSLYAKKDYASINKTMNCAIFSVILLSFGAISSVLLFSENIATSFLKESRAAKSIVCLSPSILFMSISYCIKGYFYASRKVLIPASSEFLEQAVKITSTTFLLKHLLPLGVPHGCEAVFLGISLGEFSSCLYLSLFYAKFRHKPESVTSQTAVFSPLMKIALPAMTSSLMGSFLRMNESVFIVSALKKSGLSHTAALKSYGSLYGMVMPLIIFPLTLLSSCLTLLVPEISRADGMKSRLRLKTLISRIMRFAALSGFLVCTLFIIFSKELSSLVYSAPELSSSIKTIAALSPVMFIDSVCCGILGGLGKQTKLLVFSLTDNIFRLTSIFILVPHFGEKALFFTVIFSNLLTVSLTLSAVIKSTKTHFELSGWFLKHLAAAFFTLCISAIFLPFFLTQTPLEIVFAMIFTTLLYILICSLFSKNLRSDITWLFGRMFSEN